MRGAVAVELALVSVPLIFMAVAAIDFARAIYTYDQLVKAVRDGARLLSGFDPTIPAEYPSALARNRILYGATSAPPDGATIVPDLAPGMIFICDRVSSAACPGQTFANVPTGTGSINLIRVEIRNYTFTPVFPGISRLTTITFEPISATMRQL